MWEEREMSRCESSYLFQSAPSKSSCSKVNVISRDGMDARLVREAVISVPYGPKWEAGLEKEAETPPQKFTFNLGGIWIS